VLIVSVDSLRADEVGRRVSGEPVAPAMARLGTEGVVFRHALSTAPWTTPSMMSMMTGLPAPAHGVEEHDRALAPSVGTLAERYRNAGYRTAAFVPAATLRESFGFARGFEVFDYENYGHERISSPEMIGKLIHRLEQWRKEPVFLWVHLWDPHYNYRPRPPYDTRFRRGEEPDSQDVQVLKWTRNPVSLPEAEYLHGQYQGEVAYTDRYISDLLDAIDRLELRDRTLVAVLGDHGESFLEHGWLGHTNRVDETNVHVPLILRGPGLPAGKEVEAPVSLASLGRTLLELSGLDATDFGLLAPLPVPGGARGAAPLGSSEVVSQTLRRGCRTAFYRDRLKYVVDQCTCEESLYDLAADPGETNDLASARPEELTELRAGLLARLEAIDAAGVPTALLPEEDQQQTLAALQALGYVSESEVEDLGVCEQLSGTDVRDSFGDMVARGPCPPRRALACLQPEGAGQRSATD
jgi:arylsulfatase A-like enzyme